MKIKNSVIDIGSNTLKIAYLDNGLKNYEKVLNLGLFYENESLNNAGINILIKTFKELEKRFDFESSRVVATAIFRKISNATYIQNIFKDMFGIKLEILSQQQEAFYTRKSINYENDFTLVDIGGYSIEISSNDDMLLLDIGLLSFYKQIEDLSNEKDIIEKFKTLISKDKSRISSFKPPIILANKTAIFAKSIQENKKNDEINDLEYHLKSVNKNELEKLKNLILTMDVRNREIYFGKNRDFAILIGIYMINEMFECNEFLISSYGLKEGILFNDICK